MLKIGFLINPIAGIGGKKAWKGNFDKQQWPSGESEFRNGIGLPLRIKNQTLGVIKVENKIE
ncbi:MAG: hypothetical protein KAJ30_00880, partial [Candidatus Heimdallarchaeota archaeon]|nr:hypothetical protein [Candidatus Heimdallarchaeota archaeon]